MSCATPQTLWECVEAVASAHPHRLAAVDPARCVTYGDVLASAVRLSPHLRRLADGDRPVCLVMHRSVEWYTLYLACNRVGLPAVAASRDLPNQPDEQTRFNNIIGLLNPVAVITDERDCRYAKMYDGPVIHVDDLQCSAEDVTVASEGPTSQILGYHFTGGTTAAAKCVVVSNAMAVHEIGAYKSILPSGHGKPERVLQNSSVYWPASAFGQLDIAIAFAACAVLSVTGGASPDEVTAIVNKHEVDCIGVVPSVLRGMSVDACKSLKTVLTWGESLPKSVASEWSGRVCLIDLLIATEYWLSFFSVITGSEWKYTAVAGTKTLLTEIASDSEEEVKAKLLWVGGPMVTPGYVGQVHGSRFRTEEDGNRYFCTNDTVIPESAGNGMKFTYSGRSDDLQKIGGKFVSLRVAQEEICQRVGDTIVHELLVIRNEQKLIICFVLERPVNINFLIHAVQLSLPSVGPGDVHILANLPRKAATGKVDQSRVIELVANPASACGYTIPDSEVPRNRLAALPNPSRYMWLLLVALVLSFDITGLVRLIAEFLKIAVQTSVKLPFVKLAQLPFVYHGLHVLRSDCNSDRMKKLFSEFPGDVPFLAIALMAMSDWSFVSFVVSGLGCVGLLHTVSPDSQVRDLMKQVSSLACLATVAGSVLTGSNTGALIALGSFILTTWSPSISWLTCLMLSTLAPQTGPLLLLITCIYLYWKAGLGGLKKLPSQGLVYYVASPWDLAWNWQSWWRDVPGLTHLILHYAKSVDTHLPKNAVVNVMTTAVKGMYRFFSHAWDMQTLSCYSSAPRRKGFWSSEVRKFPCDWCTRTTIETEGTFDNFNKFPAEQGKWFCETCWWGDVQDGRHQYSRIGLWTTNWIYGKMRELIAPFSATPSPSRQDDFWDEDVVSTRDPSEVDQCDDDNMCFVESEGGEIAKICYQVFESVGSGNVVLQVGGLASLSSLTRVTVHEQLKRRLPELGRISALTLFHSCNSFADFVASVEAAVKRLASADTPVDTTSDGAGDYQIPVASPSMWKNGACDWLLRFKPAAPVEDIETFYTCAVKALVKRHPALRARPLDDLKTMNWCQQAISLAPNVLLNPVLNACGDIWPRIRVEAFNESDPVPLKFEYVEGNFSKSAVLRRAANYRSHNTFVPAYEFVVFLPADRTQPPTTVFLYFRVTHLFADGYCVNTVMADLETILAGNRVTDFSTVKTMNSFQILQNRLNESLTRRVSTTTANLASQAEESRRDPMLVKVMWLQHRTVESLMSVATTLGIPAEILMMGLVVGSLAEKLGWTRMPVSLMHSMRDGIDETKMIGFFSDYKDMGFINTDCSYVELFHQLAVRIRARSWRPNSQTMYDHSVGRHAWDESMFPLSFNLLPHVRKHKDARIENVETYWRASPRNDQSDCRRIHVYMEETRMDKEWAIRLHISKTLFDCSWVVDYVCRVFDRTIKQVLSDPTRPVLSPKTDRIKH